MIHLLTGVGGSSKTLNAVKLLRESEIYKDRQVYYFNVKEVVFDDWIEIDEEQAKRWYELPTGSVIFFDECQQIFRLTDHKKETPKYITELETHRHNGFDLVCTTQHPMLTATGFRRQVGRHWHFERQFGFQRARCLKWEKVIREPEEDYHARKIAAVESLSFPKKYYGTYKSTELNTYKREIPKKLYYLAFFLVLFCFGAFHFYTNMTDRIDNPSLVSSAVTSTGVAEVVQPVNTVAKLPLDPQEYLELYKPRIDGLAHTAPIYDELMKPVRAPKTMCIRVHRSSGSECSCFTEQGTRLSVPLNRCSNIIDNGLYDPTMPVENSRSVSSSVVKKKEPRQRDNSLMSRIYPTDLPPVKVSL